MFKEINKKYIFRSIFVFLIFWNSAYFQLIPIFLFQIHKDSLSSNMNLLVLLSTFSSLVMVLINLLIYQKDLKIEFKKFKNNLAFNIDTGFKYWFIGLLVMMISNMILLTVFKSGGANNENAVQELIHALPWIMAINTCFLAPFNEEIIFRKTLKDVFKNKWVFIILSFLLFGGAHVINSATTLVDYLYIIPYGALGVSFAYAYYKTDTVFTSMVLHFFHNTCLFILSIIAL